MHSKRPWHIVECAMGIWRQVLVNHHFQYIFGAFAKNPIQELPIEPIPMVEKGSHKFTLFYQISTITTASTKYAFIEGWLLICNAWIAVRALIDSVRYQPSWIKVINCVNTSFHSEKPVNLTPISNTLYQVPFHQISIHHCQPNSIFHLPAYGNGGRS